MHDVDEWLNSVNEFAFIHGWNEKTTSHLALSKLRGTAEVWFRDLPTRLFTWEEWSSMLQKNFRPKRNLYKLLQEVMSCKPQPKESLNEYVYRKLALLHKLKIPLNDEDRVNLIMGGIDDMQIKFTIEAAGITDPHILAHQLQLLDQQQSINNNLNQTLASSKASSTPKIKHAGGLNRIPLCYRCHTPGHKRRECPDFQNPSLFRNSRKGQLALEYKNVNFVGNTDCASQKYLNIV